MANYFYDVLRVEADATGVLGLPTILRMQQLGLEADGNRRLAYKDSSGVMWYWTPDTEQDIYAYNVIYNNSDYNISDVQQALDYLLRQPLEIVSMTNDAINSNKGQTINTVTVSWGLTGTVGIIELNNAANQPGELDTTDVSYEYTGLGYGPTGAYSFTLSASNDWETVQETTTMYFKLNKYYGTSASATPNEGQIEAGTATLSIDTATSKTLSTVNITGGGNYIYYAYPAAWGALTNLYVNGFLSGWNITTVAVTNGYSNTENYIVYTSPNTIVGGITLAGN